MIKSLADVLCYWGLRCSSHELHEFVAYAWLRPEDPDDKPNGIIWVACRRCGLETAVDVFLEEEGVAVETQGPCLWTDNERVIEPGHYWGDTRDWHERVRARSRN